MGHLGSPFFGQSMIPRGKQWYPTNIQQREFPPNAYNRCLQGEYLLWKQINDCGGFQAICPGHRFPDPPWIKMPAQGKRFLQTSSIPLPNNDGLDHLVLSFNVPHGYDGVIVATVNNYNGQGYFDGSGDFAWRIKLNLHFVKDYGNMQTQLGSLQTPYSVNSGQIILLSDQLVQFYVNRAVGATNEIGGYVLCALAGWWWPR